MTVGVQKYGDEKIMKILMIYGGPYPHIGGLSTHMELMGTGLKKLGHEVDYLSSSSFSKPIQILFLSGPVFVLNKVYTGLGTIYYLYIASLMLSLKLLYKMHYERYDIINVHQLVAGVCTGLVRKMLFPMPIILTIHTYFTPEAISSGILKKDSFLEKITIKKEKKVYNIASHIMTVDNRLKDYVLSFGVPADGIDVMFNPVDTDIFVPHPEKNEYRKLFNIPEDKTVILCPRRLVKKNGVIYPVLASVYLKEKIKDFVLVYAGDGGERTAIEKSIKKYNLKNNVLLLGSVEHNKMNKLYNAADVVVIPSIHSEGMEEATSISALEAMASGVPVIASNIGGLKDIIKNGFNGILVPEKDEKELADAIYEILANKEMYKNISHNSVEYVRENFSYLTRAEFFMKVVAKVKGTSQY